MKRLFIYFILCAFSIGVHADDGVMYVYLSDGSFRGFYNDQIDSISYSHYDLDSIWHEEMMTQDIWSRDTVERLSLCMIDSISYSLPETTYKDNVIILDERYQPYILAHDSLTITFSPNLPDYLRPSVGNVLLYEGSNELFPYGFSGTVTQINGDVVLCDSASLEDVYERLYFFGTYTLVENDQGSNANGYSLCRITKSSNANRWLWGDDDKDDSDWGIFEGSVDDIPFDTYKIAEKIEFTSKNIFAAVSGSVTPTASIEFAFVANVYEPHIFYKETDRFDYDAKLQIGFNKDFTPKHPKDFDKPFRVHKVGQEAETEKGLNLYFFNISVPIPQCPVLTIGYKAGLFIDPNLEAEAVLGVDFSMTKEKTHIFSLDKTNIWKNGDWSHYEKKPTVTCEPEVEGSLTGSVWAGLMAAINVGVGSDKNGIKEELSAKIGPYIEFELNLDLIDFNSDMSFYSGLKDSKMKRGIKGVISLDFTAKMAKVFNYKWTQMQISPEKLWFEKVDYLFPAFQAPEYYTNGNTLNCSMNLTRCTFANHVGMRIVDESGNEETKWMEDTFKDWTEETPFNFGLSFDNLDFKNHRYTIIPVTRLWFFPTLKVPDPMRTYVTCPDSHHPHLIDLGLPSGVKWLCSNVYADKPTDAGGFYQWGNAYKQMSYDESYTFPDIEGSNFQGSSHDAATANLGEEYVTPTAKQFEELLSHCYKTIKYSNWAQKEGLFLKAPNGADLYLPFSGYMNGQDIESKTKGYYIVSDNNMGDGTTNNPVLELNGDENSYSSAKWYGYSVRPVSIPFYSNLILSTNKVDLKVGETSTIDVTSGNGSYSIEEIKPTGVVTASVSENHIFIEALTGGTATIIVKDDKSGDTAPIEVKVEWDHLSFAIDGTIDLKVGESSTVDITSGSGSYSIEEIKPAGVVTASISENHISIEALTGGTAIISVKDDKSGEIAPIEVKVEWDHLLLAIDGTIDLKAGESTTVDITSGSGSYSIEEIKPAGVVTASISENHVSIEALKAGTATVIVKDDKSGETVSVEVKVQVKDIPAEAIDLGLPSGTLWASYNVGATKPEEYGGYFAWGEIEEKDVYYWTTYSHCDGVSNSCHDIGADISGTKFDVAYMRWGGEWRMPTAEEFKELVYECDHQVITQNGVYGFKFTGPNGNSIFFPAAGYHFNTGINKAGSSGEYWSSTVRENKNYAYDTSMSVDYVYWDCYINRFAGLPVRPVKQAAPALEDLVLSTTSPISLKAGETCTIQIISGNGIYSIFDNTAPNVVTASINENNIIIEALTAGTATITIKDDKSGKKANIEVSVTENSSPVSNRTCPDDNHPHLIDLGLPSGTRWACCNVDDDHSKQNPTNYGSYYAWGELKGKDYFDWDNYIHCDGSYDTCHDIGSDIAGTEYDVAHYQWGGSWVMPSSYQIQELLDNCSSEWTTLNGVNGRRFTGSNGGTIFLPASGFRAYEDLYAVGYRGRYWSSTLFPSVSYWAYYLDFQSDFVVWDYSIRSCGQSVRPVSK